MHSKNRPDIFRVGSKKYTPELLNEILGDKKRPIFVDESDGKIIGYIFCVEEEILGDQSLCDMKSLYIDDLCVDERLRRTGTGKRLYEYAKNYAKEQGFYRITLNVWDFNLSAKAFYEKLGLKPLKTVMEDIL